MDYYECGYCHEQFNRHRTYIYNVPGCNSRFLRFQDIASIWSYSDETGHIDYLFIDPGHANNMPSMCHVCDVCIRSLIDNQQIIEVDCIYCDCSRCHNKYERDGWYGCGADCASRVKNGPHGTTIHCGYGSIYDLNIYKLVSQSDQFIDDQLICDTCIQDLLETQELVLLREG